MAIPKFDPPAHYSADIAYRLLRPMRPALEAAQQEMVIGITARRASLHLGNIAKMMTALGEALQAGSLSGSAEWQATAQAVLAEVTPILMAAAPIEQIYAKRVGEKIAADAVGGKVTALDEAQQSVPLDQEHIDMMRGLLDAALA